MTSRMPPVPPASRSRKGPGDQAGPPASRKAQRPDKAPPDNAKEQDRQGKIKQNTTHRGYQQDR